jgi:hypothetical protein
MNSSISAFRNSINKQRSPFRRRARCRRMRRAAAERDGSFGAGDVLAVSRSWTISAPVEGAKLLPPYEQKISRPRSGGNRINDLAPHWAIGLAGRLTGPVGLPLRKPVNDAWGSTPFGDRRGRVFFGLTERHGGALYFPAGPAGLPSDIAVSPTSAFSAANCPSAWAHLKGVRSRQQAARRAGRQRRKRRLCTHAGCPGAPIGLPKSRRRISGIGRSRWFRLRSN